MYEVTQITGDATRLDDHINNFHRQTGKELVSFTSEDEYAGKTTYTLVWKATPE